MDGGPGRAWQLRQSDHGPSKEPTFRVGRPLRHRRRRHRLAIDPLKRAPKGLTSFWARGRKLLWSWWPWLLAGLFALEQREWWWAFAAE